VGPSRLDYVFVASVFQNPSNLRLNEFTDGASIKDGQVCLGLRYVAIYLRPPAYCVAYLNNKES